jgi:hypothetical protein
MVSDRTTGWTYKRNRKGMWGEGGKKIKVWRIGVGEPY